MYHTATSSRASVSNPGDSSRTITITNDPTREEADDIDEVQGESHGPPVLRLRGHRQRTGPKVTWDEDVVDNEGAGKKKSKICCIFKATRNFDESSSDSDSDSDDSSCDGHNHDHDRGGQEGPSSNQPRPEPSLIHDCCSDGEKNAYERIPRYQKKKQKKAIGQAAA